MPEMRDSGFLWMGMIPADWKCERGKYILKYMQKPIKENDHVITCFRDGEVTLRSNRREDGFTMADKEIGYQGIDVGDLVVHGMDGFAGAIGISDSRGKASPVLNVLDTKQNKKYIMYFLRSMAYNNVFLSLATGIRVRSCDLRWSKLAELYYPIPSLDEQIRIVKFLDNKCAEIKALSMDIQTEIDTLEEYKRSVITETVTMGMHLSELVETKHPYIKFYPKNWAFIKAGYIFRENSRPAQINDCSLSLSQKDGLIKTDDMTEHSLKTGTYKGWKHVIKGDLVLNRFKAHLGVFFSSCYDGMVSFHYGVYEALLEINSKFYEYLFHSKPYCDMFAELSNGITVGLQNLSNGNFYSAKCVYPPIKEQNEIVDYLDDKCKEINAIIEMKREQLTVLDEYRKAIIYEYVTGKKEVGV